MVIKDIIYIMVVALFTVACWLQVESVSRGVNFLPLGLSTWRLLLLVGSKWNMFHVEPYFFMRRNNLEVKSPFWVEKHSRQCINHLIIHDPGSVYGL